MTAAEALASLRDNPEFARREAEREQRRKADEAHLAAAESPLLADLLRQGYNVTSVWDLVNSATRHPAAIPVLCRHLTLPYDPRIREGIARALTVRESRGAAGRIILNELQQPSQQAPHSVRWALANALTVAGDEDMIAQLESLLADPAFSDLREIIKLAVQEILASD